MMIAKSIIGITVLTSGVLASNFFVHEDVLAHPLYSIYLQQSPISNSTAQHLLEGTAEEHSSSASPTQQLQKSNLREGEYTHLLMKSQLGQSYLCHIPIANSNTSDAENEGNEELNISDSERKIRGLKLLAPLFNECIYAWPNSYFAYEFCHLRHVKQFHAVPNSHGQLFSPGNDPEDPKFTRKGSVQYVLGRFNGDQRIPTDEVAKTDNKEVLLQTDVHTFGQRSFLSQKWRFGDNCDLTGRDREINVQFHCSIQNEDEIVSVHETATCEYQMVIATPRLCQDPAFAPRARKDVNRIECDPIVSDHHYNEIEEARPLAPEETNEEGDVQIKVNKVVEKNLNTETDGYDQDTIPKDNYADELESKMAALEQELIDTLSGSDQNSDPENNEEGAKTPKIHLLDAEFLNGMTLKEFMASKNLEQQLEEISNILLGKADAASTLKPTPTKQKAFATRIQENFKAYTQKFENEEQEVADDEDAKSS